MKNRGSVSKIQYNPCCSHQFACITSEGWIRIFDTKQASYNGGEPTVKIQIGDSPLKLMDWYGKKIVTVTNKNVIVMVNINNTHPTNIGEITSSSTMSVKYRVEFPYEVTDIMWSRDGKLFITASSGKLYCVNNDEKLSEFVTKIVVPQTTTSTSMDTSDGSSVGALGFVVSVSGASLTCLDISNDNKYVVVGSEDSIVSVLELPELFCIQTHSKFDASIGSVSIRSNEDSNQPPILAYTTRNGAVVVNLSDEKVLLKTDFSGASSGILHPTLPNIAFIQDDSSGSIDVWVDEFKFN